MSAKKKISLILCIAIVVIAIAATGIFFGVQTINGKKNSAMNAANQPNSSVITNSANEAIARKNRPVNYNGVYKYDRIGYITFHLSDVDIQRLCELEGCKDVNGLRDKLSKEKAADAKNEYIVLSNSSYNLNDGLYKTKESGTYYGNDDLSAVYNESDTLVAYISLKYLDKNCTVTSEKYTNSSNKNLTNLFVMKTFMSKNNPGLALFTVTYIYEMVEVDTRIPDGDLAW